MTPLKLSRTILVRLLSVLVVISSLLIPPAFSQDSAESRVFISGFNAYRQKDYATTILRMNEVLEKYPDSPLRDMVLFWLSRAYYKSGNQQDAAKFLSQFNREFPNNPLKGTVDEELLALTARYERGEQLPGGPQAVTAQSGAAERDRLAAVQKEQERTATAKAEQAERQRIAAQKAEQERQAAAQQELERQAALKAEETRKAAAESAERERLAAVRKEQERLAAEQAERQRIAAQKAEQERQAAAQRELERQAALRAEEAKKAVAERVERERLAAVRKEQERLAAEQARAAAEQAAQQRVAREKAELEATLKVAEQKRQAALKAEQEREAAAKAAEAEQKRLAALKTEEDRLVAEKAARVRAEREKAEVERLALEKSAADARAAEQAQLQNQASLKADQERQVIAVVALPKAAAAVPVSSTAATAAEQDQKRDSAAKTALRERAIAQYKSVLGKYPNSEAAATAAAKLKALGVVVAASSPSAAEAPPENFQVLQLEVAQFAGLELNLATPAKPFNVAQRVAIPFEIVNQGNGNDSFNLESGFPAEFGPGFSSAAAPDQSINQTPKLAPGEAFKGYLSLAIPASRIDGQRITHPIRATSRSFADAAQSREVQLTAAAPLLRAVVKSDRTQLLPGDRIAYRVTVLNVGSIAARDVSLRLNSPPQLEPIDLASSGFRQEMKSALVLGGLQVKPGESLEYLLAFQLKDDSLAGQELLTRVELLDNPLKTSAAFVSNAAYVQQKRGMQVRAGAETLVVIPGQTVNVPFVVTNTGNAREKFRVGSSVTGNRETIVFQDVNRDGIRQTDEPVMTEIGPLAPKEEAGIVMEVRTPRSAADGSEASARISFVSEGDETLSYDAATRLVYSRPALQLVMTGRDGRLKPGEVATFDLTVSNRGSNLAQVVELQSDLPEQLELLAAEPAAAGSGKGIVTWRFKELGAGEKRTIKVSFRVRAGTVMGTNIQIKNTLAYEDQLGNRY